MDVSDRLRDLIERSEELVKAIRKKDSDLTPLLAEQYNDPSHFVYEILQNSEDAGAEYVNFELYRNGIRIVHDGREFDFQDVENITSFGKSDKEEDLNKIGEFGVGFKSVFAITESPKIYSGRYSLRIEDFVVPIPIDSIKHDENTIIDIPFNHEERSSGEAYELAENRLKNINKKSLLFLDSINEINWSTPEEKGHYYKDSEPVDDAGGARRVLSISESPKRDSLDEYLIFSNSGKGSSIRREEVAYKIGEAEDESRRVEPVKKSNLIVFFPTNKDTYLDFLVQGPYKTTPNREDIPLHNEKNKEIIEETSNLVSKSLPDLKKIGLLNVNFLRVLPLEEPDESKNRIYKSIHKSVSDSLRQEELLPTTSGEYVSANEALLAGPKSLTRLLDSADIEILFDKSHWLDTGITRNRTPILWDYLRNELDVEVVSFDRFARNITEDFLSRKSDQWMTQFYAQLRDQKNLWDKRGRSVLRRKPIIRTKQGEHRTPFEEDNTPRVYLPIEQTLGYPTVKQSLIEDDQSRDFLKEDLGLEPPDLFSELREHVLPRYEGEDPDHTRGEYFRDLSKMVTACLDSDATTKKRRLVHRLEDLPFLRSVNPVTGEQALRSPNEVYFSTDELRRYFDGYEGAWFVSQEIYGHFEKERVNSFLSKLGVSNCPRKENFKADLSYKEKHELRGESKTKEIEQTDYDIEGLDNFVELGITKERSLLLWKLLCGRAKKESRYSFFRGIYKWKYYSEKSARFDAKFFETLKSKSWIFDVEGNKKKPRQLTPSEMASDYQLERDGAQVLLEGLPFRDEVEEELSGERKRILELADRYGISPDELEELLEREKTEEQASSEEEGSSSDESSEDGWSPDVSPEEATSTISAAKPQKVSRPDLRNQDSSTTSATSRKPTSTEDGEDQSSLDTNNRQSGSSSSSKDIGRWGEKHVFKMLRRKYQGENVEVVWLNENSDQGEGCDLVLKEDDREIAYIEVKSKTEMNPEWVEVTQTQWEFARKLHGQEEDYWFFVLLGAGSKNPDIRKLENPIEQWKQGNRLAHPVNVKLT